MEPITDWRCFNLSYKCMILLIIICQAFYICFKKNACFLPTLVNNSTTSHNILTTTQQIATDSSTSHNILTTTQQIATDPRAAQPRCDEKIELSTLSYIICYKKERCANIQIQLKNHTSFVLSHRLLHRIYLEILQCGPFTNKCFKPFSRQSDDFHYDIENVFFFEFYKNVTLKSIFISSPHKIDYFRITRVDFSILSSAFRKCLQWCLPHFSSF